MHWGEGVYVLLCGSGDGLVTQRFGNKSFSEKGLRAGVF